MSEASLKDATIWHWWFYLRWHGYDPSKSIDQYWESFITVIKPAVEWTGAPEKANVISGSLPEARDHNKHIVNVGWTGSGDQLRSLEARVMLDAYYIESGCARVGAVTPADFAGIKAQEWSGDTQIKSFLGEGVCLTVELDQPEEIEVKAIARVIFDSWLSGRVQQIELLNMPFGHIAIPVGFDTQIFLLMVWDNDQDRRAAERVLHNLLPSLVLAQIKCQSIMREYRELLPTLHALEDSLQEEMSKVAGQPKNFHALEYFSYNISRIQAELARKLSICAEIQETLRVNIGNIERKISDSIFKNCRSEMDALLAAPLRLELEQVSTDLNYLNITQSQADRMLQGIRTMAEVRSANWERALTILFGMFVLFGVAEAFPEIHEIPLLYRATVILAAGLIVYFLIWLLSRRK